MITKSIKTILACCLLGFAASATLTSCDDMLDTDSSRQVFEPSFHTKTDSLFAALGILQGMQQLADQYVFQGEMRGDLVTTTYYTDNNLRQLADFSATVENKYDSAYVYYRVINNCNYYIAHRDTTLLTGATNVVMHEYVAVKAIRAWAYLQLVRNYGRVPFFTEPLTQISQIDNNRFPEYGLAEVVAQLAPDLEQYSGYRVPDYGNIAAGSTNLGNAKTIISRRLFIPVDVILGDLYLENGDYARAASHYVTYFTKVAPSTHTAYVATYSPDRRRGGQGGGFAFSQLPDDWASGLSGSFYNWNTIFSSNNLDEVITYIPMAVNRQRGTTTSVPLAFGYNFYATVTEASEEGQRIDEIQVEPSDVFFALSDSTDYYYYGKNGSLTDPLTSLNAYGASSKLGDQRANSIMTQGTGEDSTKVWVTKYNQANVILYRNSTVWLHLAEAFNRLGMTDAAFAILKDGINENILTEAAYVSEETREALQSTYPLLSTDNFAKLTSSNYRFCGVHTHGAGATSDYYAGTNARYVAGISPYQPDTIIGMKMQEIARLYGVAVGTTKQDSINALEDILCDEYALELAFEGSRFYDLCRLARHKNAAGLYSPQFGNIWLARKLSFKNPSKSLETEANWYLPFK